MGFLDTIGASKFVPDISLAGAANTLTRGLTIFFLMVFCALIIGAIGYFFVQFKKYKYKISIYEDVGGKGLELTRKDRGMLVKVGDGGMVTLFLKKHKVYRNAYGRRIGKNHFAFVIHTDGYWYNVKLGGLDTVLKEMKLDPIDPSVRAMYEGLRENMKEDFQKRNWLKDNIGLLVSIMSIVVVLVFMWLLADKWLSINSAALHSVELSNQVLDRISELLSATQNLCDTGVITR